MKDTILRLQDNMRDRGVDIVIVPTSDYHASEYVSDYFKEIPFLSGFTGSNATMLITDKKAYLWTDGRYYIQAESQLRGSGIILIKQGYPDSPTLADKIEEELKPRKSLLKKTMPREKIIAADHRLISVNLYKKLKQIADRYKARLEDINIVDNIYDGRVKQEFNNIWILDKKYSGYPAKKKLRDLKSAIAEEKCNCHIISSLTDIAWLLNLRGNDIESVPVFFSYLLISPNRIYLYVREDAISQEVASYLKKLGITTREYSLIYSDLSSKDFIHNMFGDDKANCLLDETSLNASLYCLLSDSMKVESRPNPTSIMKAIKNPIEIANSKKAHIRDAIAMVRFMYYLKTQCYANEDTKETELSLARYLHKLRSSKKGFIEDSFETISAYGANGAIVHYAPNQDTDTSIRPEGLYLVDSGGHYIDGTTDITRTFAMGPVTDEMKYHYTLVLKANLRLANYIFLENTTGQNLDAIARDVIWQVGLDYKHGTGHGVGHILSVHEGPNNISYRYREGMKQTAIVPGMITTDEPGLYIEGEYGIRLENELLCVDYKNNEYGKFYRFEVLTLVPFDHDCINLDMLDDRELAWLNDYHKRVFDTISPYLTEQEEEWLMDACVELVR